ncbi:MAG TPA: enoyl-CoA hydratase/isomerase family protein [Methylomirabilota bacterium]|jgi:enoyl-CoA hydratase|nr:enoyl-CoA hydratase/isomerase family protein [Methylomirabilota bacterium]
MSAPVHVSVDGLVGTLALDAPPLNLLSDPLRAGMLDALAGFRARGVRAVVVTGRGRAFCAGADLNEEAALTPERVQAFLDADEAVFTALAAFPGATIAAVNGFAYGGGFELALACDIRVAARAARFAGVGVKLGLTVSTARLTRACGEGVALDLLLTGRAVDAEEAWALGLVSVVAEDAGLQAEARRWADVVASRAPLSVRANKVGLRHCARLPLAEAVAYERGEWARLQRTGDHKEALAAFFAKRAPAFTAE